MSIKKHIRCSSYCYEWCSDKHSYGTNGEGCEHCIEVKNEFTEEEAINKIVKFCSEWDLLDLELIKCGLNDPLTLRIEIQRWWDENLDK